MRGGSVNRLPSDHRAIARRFAVTFLLIVVFFCVLSVTTARGDGGMRGNQTVVIQKKKLDRLLREKRGSHRRIVVLNGRVKKWRTKAQNGNIGAEKAIRMAFGVRAPAALRVARCESSLNPAAANGQYRGLYQTSSNLRENVPGYGPSAIQQATHAYRIFVRSGMSWQPWECGSRA